MAQSKQDKQRSALTRLHAESQALQDQRESLQCQTYGLIAPCDKEINIRHEINILEYRLGMAGSVSECPF